MSHYKIAIPEIDGQVNQHFGRSTSFAIAEIKDGEVVGISPLSVEGMVHQHGMLASALKNQGVEKAIVGGIGGGMAQSLAAQGYPSWAVLPEISETLLMR